MAVLRAAAERELDAARDLRAITSQEVERLRQAGQQELASSGELGTAADPAAEAAAEALLEGDGADWRERR